VTKIALLSFAILVAGCTSEAERLVQRYELNDSICKKDHVYGTGSYWNCRAARDQMVVLQKQHSAESTDTLLQGAGNAGRAAGVMQRAAPR
jgi:hypothetical protein